MTAHDLARLINDPSVPEATRRAVSAQLYGRKPATATKPGEPAKKAAPVPRTMNQWERQYSGHLLTLKAAGEVVWYRWEPVKLLLAPRLTYTVDFVAVYRDGRTEFIDVKGFEREDAVVKFKAAAELYPVWTFRMVAKRAGEWVTTREIKATV